VSEGDILTLPNVMAALWVKYLANFGRRLDLLAGGLLLCFLHGICITSCALPFGTLKALLLGFLWGMRFASCSSGLIPPGSINFRSRVSSEAR
jgi:hypothetical protein